jgi:hypothetical protein
MCVKMPRVIRILVDTYNSHLMANKLPKLMHIDVEFLTFASIHLLEPINLLRGQHLCGRFFHIQPSRCRLSDCLFL